MSGYFDPSLQAGVVNPITHIAFSAVAEGLDFDDFDASCKRVARRLDKHHLSIDMTFRRKEESKAMLGRGKLAWFRAQVKRVPVMDRQEELAFTMMVEFLWRRLKTARRACGFSKTEVEQYPGVDDERCVACPPGRELICKGCAPRSLSAGKRARLRARTHEFIAARNELMERNLHIVFRLLEKYSRVGVPVEDMVQEANNSLFKAVQGFDFLRGFRFKTYAGYWINQAFLNAIYNQSRTVRVPAYIQKAMKKMRDAVESAGDSTLFFNPHELAQQAGMTEELVKTALKGNRYSQSIHRKIDSDEACEMLDLFDGGDASSAPDFKEDVLMLRHLGQAMGRLTEREQSVVRMRFGLGGEEPCTLSEVGAALGISLERVRQIQRISLEKMRAGDHAQSLQQFV